MESENKPILGAKFCGNDLEKLGKWFDPRLFLVL
jgi:hypothetical protein